MLKAFALSTLPENLIEVKSALVSSYREKERVGGDAAIDVEE